MNTEISSLNRSVGELTGELRSFRTALEREHAAVLERLTKCESRLDAVEEDLDNPDGIHHLTIPGVQWGETQRMRQSAWSRPTLTEWLGAVMTLTALLITLHVNHVHPFG